MWVICLNTEGEEPEEKERLNTQRKRGPQHPGWEKNRAMEASKGLRKEEETCEKRRVGAGAGRPGNSRLMVPAESEEGRGRV